MVHGVGCFGMLLRTGNQGRAVFSVVREGNHNSITSCLDNQMKLYLIGSLRNPEIPKIAQAIRGLGIDVFDDWYSPGPETDEKWQEYEAQRGRGYKEALAGRHAQHVFKFDKCHLDDSQVGVLVLPAGKSGHMELGYLIGYGKPCYVLFDKEPDRFDIMYQLATAVFFNLDELLEELKRWKR